MCAAIADTACGAPENTIPALAAAARLGAIGVRNRRRAHGGRRDRAASRRDPRPHDLRQGPGRTYTLARTPAAGCRSVVQPSFAGTRVPTLREALATARSLGMCAAGRDQGAQARRCDDRQARCGRSRRRARRRRAGDLVRPRSLVEVQTAQSRDQDRDHHPRAACRHRCRRPKAGAASVAIEWDMFHPTMHRRFTRRASQPASPSRVPSVSRSGGTMGWIRSRAARRLEGRPHRRARRRRHGRRSELVRSSTGTQAGP